MKDTAKQIKKYLEGYAPKANGTKYGELSDTEMLAVCGLALIEKLEARIEELERDG